MILLSVALPCTTRLAFAVSVTPLGFQGVPFFSREHEFTFVASQETVVEPPYGTRFGEAEIVTLGSMTVTDADFAGDGPAGPTQVSEKFMMHCPLALHDDAGGLSGMVGVFPFAARWLAFANPLVPGVSSQ